jgi:NAD(P)-dependent dehydrogenase (short-subunit alcohol dehydrogenase family)
MIVVTGAAGVLGQAVAKALVGAGHKVAAIDLAGTIGDVGQAVSLGGIDLTSPTEVEGAFGKIAEQGGISGLVNVAGGFRWETIADGSVDSWDFLYRINVRTALIASRAALPFLRASKGAVVNVAANAAVRAAVGMGAYTASKSGVMRLTESLASEELDNFVRVNAVMPSIIDTPVNRRDMPDAEYDRWVTPEQIAAVIAFLLSPAATAITGACIPVTGRV